MQIYFLKFPLEDSLGGAEFHTLKLARHFQDQGHRVNLITSDHHLFRLFEKHKLPRLRMFMGWEPTSKWSLFLWPLTFLIARFRLKKLIRAAPPDSIFFCQSLTEKLILPALSRFTTYPPDITRRESLRAGNLLLTTFFLEHKIPGRWLRLNPLKFLFLKYAKRVTIVTVSQFAKNEFVRLGIPEKNIEVVYPSSPAVIARVRPKQSQFTIGILSRLDPEKGILNFLNSVIPGLIRNPSWRILIAGDGQQKQEIEAFIRQNGLQSQIKLLGFVYDKSLFFSQISVLVCPSLVPESFGISVLEAMAHGIPVVSNDLGALPEIIKHEQNGFLVSFPPLERGGLGRGREWINHVEEFQNPSTYQKFSAAALATTQNFSESKMLSAFDQLLQK